MRHSMCTQTAVSLHMRGRPITLPFAIRVGHWLLVVNAYQGPWNALAMKGL